MGRTGGWGGSEYGAEGSMGRKAHPNTPASTLTLKLRHFSARREASTLLMKFWLRGHLRTFGHVEIRSPLFRKSLNVHVSRLVEGVAYGPYSMSARPYR
jgi:hypothetical protein